MNRLAFAVVFLGLTGCNMAMRRALERAEAAHARGDHFGEAVALRDACKADRSEKEICAAAKQSADEVIAKQLETASGPCATEPSACIAALSVLSPFAGADDPRLLPYFDRAGDMIADKCRRAPLDSPEDAVFHVRCIEAYRLRVPTAAFATHIGLERQRAGAWLDQVAAKARSAQPGVAWLHESLAGCLGGTSAYAPRVAAYRAEFDDAHAVRLAVTGSSPYAPADLCRELMRDVGGMLRCEGRAGSTLAMSVDGWLDQMTDSPIREVRSAEVLDHVERWENPDYRYAQQNVRHSRNRYDDAQRHSRLADSECDAARSQLSRAKYCYNCYARSAEETACNRKNAMDDIERRSRNELSDAERVLSNTPSILTREVFRNVSYRHTQHRFRVPWHVRVALSGRVAFDRSGALSFESIEREGVPGANISYAPYSEPTQSQLRVDLAAVVSEGATAALTAELERLAQARTAVCPAPDQWSDCQVEAALLRRTDPVAQFVADVGTKLDAKTPQPWPQAPCAP